MRVPGKKRLRTGLEGTENRIAVERMRYNDNVRDYNTRLKKMPRSIIAGMYGFEPKLYFEAEKGSEVAPKVNFIKNKMIQNQGKLASSSASLILL